LILQRSQKFKPIDNEVKEVREDPDVQDTFDGIKKNFFFIGSEMLKEVYQATENFGDIFAASIGG
jgi:hypothetical protein